MTAGESTATGATVADWHYSGNGTSINPTSTFDTEGDGENLAENSYTLDSDWVGSAWALNYGTQNTTVVNSGDWNTTTSQAYDPTVSGIAMFGTQTLSHNSAWDVTGSQAQTWDDEGAAWVTNSQTMSGNITTLDLTYSPASASFTTATGPDPDDITLTTTASDNQTNQNSTSSTFSSVLGNDGSTTWSGSGTGSVNDSELYNYSLGGSVSLTTTLDGGGTSLHTNSSSDWDTRNTSVAITTGWSLGASGTWTSGNTTNHTTVTGNAGYSNSSSDSVTDAQYPTGNSTNAFLQTESLDYSYSQNPTNTVSGDGDSAISGSGTFSAAASGTLSSSSQGTVYGGYQTYSDITTNRSDVYSDSPQWSEDYSSSGAISRTDTSTTTGSETDVYSSTNTSYTPGTSYQAGSSYSSASYSMSILDSSPFDSGWVSDAYGNAQPSGGSAPSTNPVGTMPSVTDTNSAPGQVGYELSNAALSGQQAQSIGNNGVTDGDQPLATTAPADSSDVESAAADVICFAAGTLVLMADGTSKPIEGIEVGEMVLASPESNAESAPRACRVVQVFHNPPCRLLHVRAGETLLRCTFGHPFYIRRGGWVHAEDLKPGDELRQADGRWTVVDEVADGGVAEPVFNLRVAECHTYFVLTPGRVGVLVHNSYCGSNGLPPASSVPTVSLPPPAPHEYFVRAAPPRTKTQYVEQGLREVVNSVNLYTANTLNLFISINNNWQRKINDVLGKGGTGQVMITSSGQKLYGGEIELINVEDHQFDNDIFADPNADAHVRTGSHIFGFGLGVYDSFAFGTSVPATPPPVPEITVPPVEVSAAESESLLAGSIRNVNPTGGTMNCVNCSIATDATLAGNAASALPGSATPISVLEDTFGGQFQPVSGPMQIGSILSQSGNGARGIVFGESLTGDVGHVFNVINKGGEMQFLDGQVGGEGLSNFDNFQNFQFLQTHPGTP